MASVVLEKMMSCDKCQHDTLHRKNAKKMRWIMHILLTVITAGLWLFVLVLLFVLHVINKTATSVTNSWTCSVCGDKKLIAL